MAVGGREIGRGPRRIRRRDAVLAGAALAGGLVLLSIGTFNTVQPPNRTPRAVYLVPLLAVCAAVLLRRRATRTSLAVGTLAAVGDVALGGSLGTLLVYTQVLYDACVFGPARLWRWLLRISVVATVLGSLLGVAVTRAWHGVGVGVVFTLVAVLPVLTGISVRQYRDQAAAERERAEQTARLADLDRRRAISAERTRMARELHDVVANHLSAVAIHATAALSLRDLDEAGVRRALTVIRSSSVQGLAEMRRMIELLRDGDDGTPADGAPTDGAPDGGAPDRGAPDRGAPDGRARADGAPNGMDRAELLVERARQAGLVVSRTVTGPPRALPETVDTAAYRILQESLTNALKHGGEGRVEVDVDYARGHLALTVRSPLRARGGTGAAVPGAGAGLVGMRERTELLGGTLRVGRTGRHWTVRAELPTPVDGRAAS